MDENNKNSDSKSSYDALRSMFLHPPVYLPPPLGQTLDGLVPLPGQGAASNLMYGHPFAPGLPMLPYRDFAYLPFPAAAAALDSSRSGQSPTDGAAAASAASFWTGLYPFVADPFLAEAMKMNLSPYLASGQDTGKEKKTPHKDVGKKATPSPKTDLRDNLKRKPERSSSTQSDGSSSSHDRQTPGAKSPASTTTTSSPHRKDQDRSTISYAGPPPPLIKTPPLAHERKRPKLEPLGEEALDFSSKPRLLDNRRTLIPAREPERERQREKSRGAPNFGDVEWLSNPDSSPKAAVKDKTVDLFLSDPRSVLRGEALQVRIAQYNVSQLRSKLDLESADSNSWTARIEPDFTDLGQYRDKPRLESDAGSAFERVEQQRSSRDSVIVTRSEPRSFSERMSDIARRHAAANDLKDSGLDLRGLNKTSMDLRSLSYRHHEPELKPNTNSKPEPSNHTTEQQKPRTETPTTEKSGESLTLKDSVDNILDSILNTYTEKGEGANDCATHSKTDDEQDKVEDEVKETKIKETKVKDTKVKDTTQDTGSNDTEPEVTKEETVAEVGNMSGGEMHGLTSSFLPLSEVLSTAISSEFARSQKKIAIPNSTIPNTLFSQQSLPSAGFTESTAGFTESTAGFTESTAGFTESSANFSATQTRDDSPQISIENIIDRLEREDTGEQDEEPKGTTNTTANGSTTRDGSGSVASTASTNSAGMNSAADSPACNANSPPSKFSTNDMSKQTSDKTGHENHQTDVDKLDVDQKTKLVLIKDSRNGYAVKGKGQDGLVTSAVVDKVVDSVMLGQDGLFKVPDMTSDLTT